MRAWTAGCRRTSGSLEQAAGTAVGRPAPHARVAAQPPEPSGTSSGLAPRLTRLQAAPLSAGAACRRAAIIGALGRMPCTGIEATRSPSDPNRRLAVKLRPPNVFRLPTWLECEVPSGAAGVQSAGVRRSAERRWCIRDDEHRGGQDGRMQAGLGLSKAHATLANGRKGPPMAQQERRCTGASLRSYHMLGLEMKMAAPTFRRCCAQGAFVVLEA